jgi:hypothetical protein
MNLYVRKYSFMCVMDERRTHSQEGQHLHTHTHTHTHTNLHEHRPSET